MQFINMTTDIMHAKHTKIVLVIASTKLSQLLENIASLILNKFVTK